MTAVPETPSPARPAAAPLWVQCGRMVVLGLIFAWLALIFWNSAKPLPAGTHVVSQTARLSEADVDFLPELPLRLPSRDAAAVDHAEQLIVLDRSPITLELKERLLARKRVRPNIKIVAVTDPGHEAFGGTPFETLRTLEQAGIVVARVRLERLRDSNPLYSGMWRLLLGWWTDPFEEAPARAGLPAWFRARNFKADQRQLLVADDGSGGWIAIVAPAGPGAGLVLRGALARAMIASELQVAKWSTDDDRLPSRPPPDGGGPGSIDARFLTEGANLNALLEAVAAAGDGDHLGIAVRNFSERRLIAAALGAAARGANLRVLLSREPSPNQAVAGELLRGSGGHIEVRWYAVDPGASHPALLIVRHRTDLLMNWGSANFTRRSLDDLNLEAGVELRMPLRAAPARAVVEHFDRAWSHAAVDGQTSAHPADAYWHYRIAEATGLSSF